jgi:methylthioribulose-1-phosphate dehydratase
MDAFLRAGLISLIHLIHRRGWAPGTGGNFSALLSRAPFRLLITPSGIDKGTIKEDRLLEVDEHGTLLLGSARPSAETLLHIAVINTVGAQVVLHTHSIWNTLASLKPSAHDPERFELAGFEMLKGLRGVTTHQHVEAVPILDNSQDMPKLRAELERTLGAHPGAHAVLVAGHGLYTWGHDLAEAQRHLEVLEFLFEVALRRA